MAEKTTSNARRYPVQERAKVTVSAIREAAVQVLVAEGYERATTNRIAARAGVSIGTLYQYFPGREAVFDAVIDETLQVVVAAAGEALAGTHDAPLEARLSALTQAVLQVAARRPSVLRQLDAIPGSSFRSRLQAAKARATALVQALLEEHAHVVRPRDPALAARIIADLGEGLMYNLREEDDAARLADEVTAMIVAWLLPP